MTEINDPRFRAPNPYDHLDTPALLNVSSADVSNGEALGEGQLADKNVSPQLAWSDVPEGTKSFAITCYDPDAPTLSGFWHWAAFNIPVDTTELPTGAGSAADLGVGAISLNNDAGQREFYGAAPPEGDGPHRYLFSVHAVDVEKLDIDENASPTVLSFNLNFHTVARGYVWGHHEN